MTQFTEIYQPELWFFNPDDPPPSNEVRASWADSENPSNPLHNFVGNRHAVRRLCRAAFAAFGLHNHQCDQSFALLGPHSIGKATLARKFGELIGIPFVEIKSCADTIDIFIAIAEVLENTKLENCQNKTLELQDLGGGEIMVPPCIVFLDDVQCFPKKVEQGLRQAVAGRFHSSGWKFDSKTVSWIISSTERLIPDGFDRFTKLHLKPLNVQEVAQVLELNYPGLPAEVSLLIAQYAPSPRDALAFIRELAIELEMHDGDDWKEVAAAIAEDWGVALWKNRVSRNGRH